MIRVVPAQRPCDTENVGDFHRYYRFAWVGWHRHPEGPQPVNIQAAAEDSVTVQDLNGRAHLIPWRNAVMDLSFGTPDLGMVNSNDTIIYLYRQAPREPHRGYRPGATNHTLFNGWQIRTVVPRLDPGNATVIQKLFFPEYYEVKEALEELRQGRRVGCALSRNLGLFTQSGMKYPGIAYRRNTIGYLEDEKRAVIPKMYLDALSHVRDKLGVEVIIK